MEAFYIIVCVIALAFFVVCLIIIGIMLHKSKSVDVFPPTQAKCPDGWFIDGSYCRMGDANKGTGTIQEYGTVKDTYGYQNHASGSLDFTNVPLCTKQKWANNYSIKWDGVTNYTKC